MPDRRAELKARLLAIFRVEAAEHLQAIEELARRWPSSPGVVPEADLVEQMFRAVHTLKGAARSVAQQDVESLCQDLETELAGARRGDVSAGLRVERLLRPAIDRLRRSVLALPAAPAPSQSPASPSPASVSPAPADPGAPPRPSSGWGSGPSAPAAEPTPAAPPPAAARPPEPEQAEPEPRAPEPRQPEPRTVEPRAPETAAPVTAAATARVDMAGLDRLLHAVEELVTLRAALDQRVAAISEVIEGLADQQQHTAEAGRRRLEAQLWRLRRAIQQDRRGLENSLGALAGEARRLRTSPAWSVLQALPPMLEDIAQAQGKSIVVETAGFERMLDRRVLEAVKDPLIHLVRNAIEVQDDGRGIDPARVRDAAQRLRLVTAAELDGMEPQQMQELVFRSGLSTSTIVTTISGQGLGLAIVRDRIESLGGHVELRTAKGEGLTVTLVVPTTIAAFRGLRVEAGGQGFLLPMESVAGVVRRPRSEQWQTGIGRTLSWRNEAVPAALLSRVLGMRDREGDGSAADPMFCAVVVEAGEERGALIVDAVDGEHSLLLKPLPSPLVRVRNVAAAALMADGDVTLVLRPADLLRSLHLDRSAPADSSEQPRRATVRVLIVDDSVTTRLMEQNLFEAAGYDVRLAADGLEALAVLRDQRVDIVVSDVDMPGVNGFELTRRIRAEQRLADLPVILVTALESREDKEEGLRAGANAYVTKSDFDQSRLLEIVRRMA